MELAQLRYFVAVLEEKGFSKGAERENVVQSAASSAIARLEHELGTSLLRRDTRPIEPTAAGLLVYRRALQALGTIQGVHDSIAELQQGIRGEVSLGVILTSGSLSLSRSIAGYTSMYPGVDVKLQLIPGPATTRLNVVRDGLLDLALVPAPMVQPPDVIMEPIGAAQLALAGPLDLDAEDPLTPAEAATRPFIDFPLTWGNRTMADQFFAQRGLQRRVAIECTDLASVLDLVAAGAGVAFVPDTSKHPGVTLIPLTESPDPVTLVLVRSALHPSNAAARSMWKWLTKQQNRSNTEAE